MAPRWLRSRAGVPSWAELRERVLEMTQRQFPAVRFSVADLDAEPALSWTDGPGGETVAEELGDVPGWTLMSGQPGGDVAVDGPVLFVDRVLSDEALAVGLVRFYASQGRHWSSSEGPIGREAWRAMTGTDNPTRSGYPIPDTVACLLLAAPDPTGLPSGPTRADVLSAKLAAVGYERLWSVAFAAVL